MKNTAFLVCIFLLLSVEVAYSQTKDKITYSAKEVVMERRNTERVRKLIGNVVFKQKETTVYCDSAYFFRNENIMEAFGNVRIVEKNTVITSKKLIYEGNSRLAKLREQVVYNEEDKKLYTDFLDYQLDDKIATYFFKGRLEDATNTLQSKKGIFYSQANMAYFYQEVILKAPDFTLESDTLRYNTETKIAYTTSNTKIIDRDSTTLYADGGEFRTELDQTDFVQGTIDTKEYQLKGDELYFDDKSKLYRAFGHVVLTSKTKNVIITGEEGFYDKLNGLSKVYGAPVFKKIMEEDTLFIAADTLVALESDYDSLKRILAYQDIRMFKSNLQGLADSLAYFQADSLIRVYQNPIMWNEKSQVVSDTIDLLVNESEIKEMIMKKNAFMISQDTLLNFNQVKGRLMHAFFKENQMDYVWVDGNSESLFYSLEEGDSTLMGLNKLICSTIKLTFTNNEIENITVYTNPEGKFIPPHELSLAEERLDGFSWEIQFRPQLIDIFDKKPIERNKKSHAKGTSNQEKRSERPPSSSTPLPKEKQNRTTKSTSDG